MRAWFAACGCCALCSGCSIGEGEGSVTSDRLYAPLCWNAAYDLKPDFFGASPFADQMTLRVQHGEKEVEVSDGVTFVIANVAEARAALGTEINIALPAGVRPPHLPEVTVTDPPLVTMALYLHDSCHQQNVALYAVSGSITFDALFSGDINEDDAADRLTDARFSVVMGDPRDGFVASEPGEPIVIDYPPERLTTVTGWFRFFFNRGRPGQAFP